jgi:endonuclease III
LKNLAYHVCLILSAVTTDWAAIHSTVKLYQAGLLNIEKLIEVKNDDIEKCIWRTDIQHKHSQFLKDLAAELKSKHGGEVPCKKDAIEKLPGVARKTRVILRNEGFGVWEGIGGDIHLHQLSIAFGYMKEEKGDTGEHAEAALCEWCQIFQCHDMNKVFGSFAPLVTRVFQTVKKTVEDKKRSWCLVKAIGDYIHKPYHVELLWFMIRFARRHYFASKLSK